MTDPYTPPTTPDRPGFGALSMAGEPPPAPRVTFAAERVVRHAAILFIVVTYVWIALTVLGFLFLLAGLGSL